MEILIKAAQFLLSLSILIILHEAGHFILAKIFKTRVEKFYLFFDPWFSILKKKIGETEYGLGWLPLGGYVKISGMIDESMDKEAMKLPPQPWEFRSKPGWQRLLIMLGGVLVNFILALFIYVLVLYTWGESYIPTKNLTAGVMVDSVAMNIGLHNGDKILSIDGKETENYMLIIHDIVVNDAKTLQIEREGNLVEIEIPENVIAPLLKTSYPPILPRVPYYVMDFSVGSPAKKAGIEVNDKIIGVNGTFYDYWDQFKEAIPKYKNQSIVLSVLRNEKDTLNVNIALGADGKIGVKYDYNFSRFYPEKIVTYSFFQSIPAGINKGFRMVDSYLKQLKLLFKPETKAYESIGGFLKIGSIFSPVWDWQSFWNMTAFLSIILAIMNVLPIPALDGGHVAFLLYEMITGRKPGDKFMEYAQITGMVILFTLLIYANGNDIVQYFKK
jgi:regulator of sigma E protease